MTRPPVAVRATTDVRQQMTATQAPQHQSTKSHQRIADADRARFNYTAALIYRRRVGAPAVLYTSERGRRTPAELNAVGISAGSTTVTTRGQRRISSTGRAGQVTFLTPLWGIVI